MSGVMMIKKYREPKRDFKDTEIRSQRTFRFQSKALCVRVYLSRQQSQREDGVGRTWEEAWGEGSVA